MNSNVNNVNTTNEQQTMDNTIQNDPSFSYDGYQFL